MNFESMAVKPSRASLRPAVMGREDREGEDGNLFFICKSFLYISFFIYLFCLYFFIYIVMETGTGWDARGGVSR